MSKQIHWPKWDRIDELAAELGVKEHARAKWRQRHVPYKYRLPILSLAQKRGIPIKEDDLEPVAA